MSGDSIDISVVPYASCAAEVMAFRNANRPVQRDAGYFHWRYEARPCRAPAQIVWARNERGEAVGAASLIPREFFVLDRVEPVGLVGDISVLPAARGRGVAERMLRALREAPAVRVLGGTIVLPNAQVSGALARAGWQPCRSMPRWARVLDYRVPLQRRLGAAGTAVGALANLLTRPWAPRRPADGFEGSWRPTAQFDARFDDLWQRVHKSGAIVAVRDRLNLAWRFTAYPGHRYELFELTTAGRLVAYAATRMDGRAVLVSDFLAEDRSAARALATHLLHAVRERKVGADVQVRSGPDDISAGGWRDAGFRRRVDEQAVMVSDGRLTPDAVWHLSAADKDV